jgi:hypothetical protein
MHNRGRALTIASALVVALLIVSALASAQNKGSQKVDKARQAEIAQAVKIVDDVMAGQPGPGDFTFTWLNHFMKSRDNKEYVPFLLGFDKDQKIPPTVSYYVRVVDKATIGEQMKAMAAYKASIEKADNQAKLDPENTDLADAASRLREKAPKMDYAFEDFKTYTLNTGGQAFTIPSALMVGAGEYDVYVLLKEPLANVKDKKAQPRAGLLKTSITVPNFWNDELATSSVLVTNQVEQLKTQPTQDEINRNPYVFGMTKVTIPTEARFAKASELSIIFYIYNTGLDQATGKPNLTVDYAFYRKADGGEKFFNRTQPQAINATTLDPSFDPKMGHQVPGGLAIPLASFPEGDYRLEIKISDKVTGKTKIQSAPFTVTAQ